MLIKYEITIEKELKKYLKDIKRNGMYDTVVRYITSYDSKDIIITFKSYNYNMSSTMEKIVRINAENIYGLYNNEEVIVNTYGDNAILDFITSNHYMEAYPDNRKNMFFIDNPDTLYHYDTVTIFKAGKNDKKGTYISHSDIGTDNNRIVKR